MEIKEKKHRAIEKEKDKQRKVEKERACAELQKCKFMPPKWGERRILTPKLNFGSPHFPKGQEVLNVPEHRQEPETEATKSLL